jgi:hypothetical protein
MTTNVIFDAIHDGGVTSCKFWPGHNPPFFVLEFLGKPAPRLDTHFTLLVGCRFCAGYFYALLMRRAERLYRASKTAEVHTTALALRASGDTTSVVAQFQPSTASEEPSAHASPCRNRGTQHFAFPNSRGSVRRSSPFCRGSIAITIACAISSSKLPSDQRIAWGDRDIKARRGVLPSVGVSGADVQLDR